MITVSVSGAAPVAAGLDTLAAQVGDLSPAMRELEVQVESVAEPLIPFLSGELAASLVTRVDAEGFIYTSESLYAGVQSYGWPARNIEPAGFMQAAEETAEQQGPVVIEDLLTDTARRAGLI